MQRQTQEDIFNKEKILVVLNKFITHRNYNQTSVSTIDSVYSSSSSFRSVQSHIINSSFPQPSIIFDTNVLYLYIIINSNSILDVLYVQFVFFF